MAVPTTPCGAPGPVGVVGLGDMGGAIARSLLERGYEVIGYDPSPAMVELFQQAGGRAVSQVGDVVADPGIVITCLPTTDSLLVQTLDPDEGLLSGTDAADGALVIEMSTFELDVKTRARAKVEEHGGVMLDCPISGTAHQAADRDLVVFASGDSQAISNSLPVFDAFSRKVIDVGDFGDGSKAKYLANLLVGIHNAAAGEALTLATKSGMDPAKAFEALVAGAGSSRMLEVRGPFMLEGDYREGSSGGRTYAKDRGIIGQFARDNICPVPLFQIASQLHDAAIAQGFDNHDSAAVCAASLSLAGLEAGPLTRDSSAG